MIESARSPRPHESAVPGWCTSRCPSHRAERRAGKGTPTSGQFSRSGPAQPAEGGRREGPRVRDGSPLGRDPGVQRHPDGCVVHTFRCASRSGADRRSAFPCGRRHPLCWGPGATTFSQQLPRGRRSLAAGTIWTVGVPAWGCIFTATSRRSAQFSRWGLPDQRHHLDGGVPVRPALSQQPAGGRSPLSHIPSRRSASALHA